MADSALKADKAVKTAYASVKTESNSTAGSIVPTKEAARFAKASARQVEPARTYNFYKHITYN